MRAMIPTPGRPASPPVPATLPPTLSRTLSNSPNLSLKLCRKLGRIVNPLRSSQQTLNSQPSTLNFFPLLLSLFLLAVPSLTANAAVPFTATFECNYSDGAFPDIPRIYLRNDSRTNITRLEMTIGDITRNFHIVFYTGAPPGGTIAMEGLNTSAYTIDHGASNPHADTLIANFTGFGPGETASIYVELDDDSSDAYPNDEDFRTVFFNNGTALNSIIKVFAEDGSIETLVLPDPGAADLTRYVFESESRPRAFLLRSVAEAAGSGGNDVLVNMVQIKINEVFVPGPNNQPLETASYSTILYDDEIVEIIAPQEVYKAYGTNITASAGVDADGVLNLAEERFTAIGISVNNVPQSGDPTYYRFSVDGDVNLKVKWRHDYALVIESDFTDTQQPDYVGPLSSQAEGNPEPLAKKNWIKKGDTVVPQIDGQVEDFSHPGLPIRYVSKGYRANGPPSFGGMVAVTNAGIVEYLFSWSGPVAAAVDLKASPLPPPQRQQLPEFTMTGPGRITYLWQVQFGVAVNVDSLSRASIPRVFGRNPTNSTALIERGTGEGTAWFNPGEFATVASPSTNGPLSLNGWINGDGYWFSSSAVINQIDGTLSGGTTNGTWIPAFDFTGSEGTLRYRGLEIAQLVRPARVMWTYGNQAIAATNYIGEFVFQSNPLQPNSPFRDSFTIPPDNITVLNVSGLNGNVGSGDMTVWDSQAKKLFPVVPGLFRATWRTGADFDQTNDVLVTVYYPSNAHYPHIAGTPPVALDPDPADDFIFKEIKYTENSAAVDNDRRFTASLPGNSVLVFGQIQRDGRGTPREFVQVRVVQTRTYQEVLDYGGAIIGRKITAPDLDGANLGTGYLIASDHARYNPFIYDSTRLEGLASRDIYDMAALRSTAQQKLVVHPDKLPGVIIPVNLHPGAQPQDRIIVAWYADPSKHDLLLWPHRARSYSNRWPANVSEGLGRIVIASQYGSEGLIVQNNLQSEQFVLPELTVPGVGTFPAETTYNPSRFQQVQVYNQPNNSLPGYNPNEEHALIAPSLRYADVSPRPPAVYALRVNDLNTYDSTSGTEASQPLDYTSHPYVLVQFLDTADSEMKMRVYSIAKDDVNITGYRFAIPSLITTNSSGTVSTSANSLQREPHVVMEAGEPVIPFYPLGVVIGASPMAQTYGINLKPQATYWEDHKGTSWAVSGGTNAWFTASFHYPLAPDFYWPPNRSGFFKSSGSSIVTVSPQAGDPVAFLPVNIKQVLNLPTNSVASAEVQAGNEPTKILFKSDWPAVAPVLKAGETLTFSGGEFRADHPTIQTIDTEGQVQTVETPGLPGILAFAAAEVVFDTLNPTSDSALLKSSWTVRAAQVLDVVRVDLNASLFPAELAPANGRTRVKQGKYIFNDLPASLQKRMRYDPLAGKLEFFGLLNDKDIGDSTLTASPPAVYVLEPNILTEQDAQALEALDSTAGSSWDSAVRSLKAKSQNPNGLASSTDEYLVGLEPKIQRDPVTEKPVTVLVNGIAYPVTDPNIPAPYRAFGPGLALLPNSGFLDPLGKITIPNVSTSSFPDISWVTVAENNDPAFGGSPVTLHIIKVDRRERYRGAIQTVASDNVFDENLILRHAGDFGANANQLIFEWWYRPDDGSLNVPPPDFIPAGQTSPWKLFPDPSGNRGLNRYETVLKGNPNAPEALLADTFWFVRYRHTNDLVQGTDWNVPQTDASGTVVADRVNFTWAGAGNSDPFHDFDLDGIPDYRAQLAMGWIKRVLDAVNPYEARIRDFEGENPSTRSSMISQFGARFEGPVALNPDKNVIENVGLIELYETILKRGSDLSINLSRPVSTPAIANALQLASTRLADFYTVIGHEAYADAMDPTVGYGNDADGGDGVFNSTIAPAIFAFQNQLSSLIDEELGLLRGVDDYFARPVYNRLFWNFTKGEGEAAYALNYNITDINMDGFIDEDDAMILFPQGHGDAWGHYLTAIRYQYDLLRHDFFNWVSRSEFYNLQDIVIKVDFLDERKFAQIAADRAKAGANILNLTYRQKYVEDPTAQWQGYSDSNPNRAWGVQGWARRAGQAAYFDWVTANALLPSQHPNKKLEGIQKVDRKANSDITVISANLNAIQTTFDQANKGQNPVGVSGNVVPFDISPPLIDDLVFGKTHFEQIYDRAIHAIENAVTILNNANQNRNRIRLIGNSEAEFRNSAFQEDLSYRNQLIKIFGKPYPGTVGPGKIYPAGYDGPDLLLYMYVNVRQINNDTVPRPTATFASFSNGELTTDSDIYKSFQGAAGGKSITNVDNDIRLLFSPTFAADGTNPIPSTVSSGWYSVQYTDLVSPKVNLVGLTNLLMPITAAGYTFQAPPEWGTRPAVGELQLLINQMVQQESQVASAIGVWDALSGEILRTLRLNNARLEYGQDVRAFLFGKIVNATVLGATKFGFETASKTFGLGADAAEDVAKVLQEAVPETLPTGGLAISPGDALSALRAGFAGGVSATKYSLKTTELVLDRVAAASDLLKGLIDLGIDFKIDNLDRQYANKEQLAALENLVGDEPIRRIEIFKEIEALRALADQYRSLVDEGSRLVDERTAFNKRVAAQTQRNRYQDLTFRIAENHALQNYRAAFDIAAKYTYLAAKAYDYETNLDPGHEGSPESIYGEIIRARSIGVFDGEGRPGPGLSGALAKLKANYDLLKSQLGINNPQIETGKMSLRTEHFRILPRSGSTELTSVEYLTNTVVSGTGTVTTLTTLISIADPPSEQPSNTVYAFPSPGVDSDEVWHDALQKARVDDLWQVPEYRYYCRPFASESDASGAHVEEPGLVLRFSSEIVAGRNFFGRPLSGGDHAYDPSHYATKIRSIGVWFSDYLSGDVLNDLPATPRVYLVPAGVDLMSIPSSLDPGLVRMWKVVDQQIPVPIPAATANLDSCNWIPLLDSLNGRLGEPRRYPMFRAYHDGGGEVNLDELVSDSRLIGRSVWNTQWLLIVPGRVLNENPDVGLDRFIEQVSDIKLVFETYGYSGN